jgi:hypothetical protein
MASGRRISGREKVSLGRVDPRMFAIFDLLFSTFHKRVARAARLPVGLGPAFRRFRQRFGQT